MRSFTRRAASAVLSLSASAALAAAQGTVTPPATNPPPIPSLTPPPAPPAVRPTGVAAKVNNLEIPEVAVYRALRQFPPAEQEIARREILNHLIDNAIVDQYLNALKITAEPAEVDKLIAELKDELKKATPPKDYATELQGMMLTEAEFRAEVTAQMKWDKFVKQQTPDETLKKFFEQRPSLFDGSMVRCRHILMNPGSDPAKRDQARATLLKIKQTSEDEGKKAAAALPAGTDAVAREKARGKRIEECISEYAKQFSVCPSKKDGGDLNFFPRVGAMVEPFAKAAFALPVYGMSDVVETEFGLHLILCTEKKPGVVRPFEQVKENVRSVYAVQLREAVLGQMKPKASITVTPVTTTTGLIK
ncbi:MAG TPA: peptidyl-prolyl cis-trans isomerase [Fimbriiglobus sp.]|jgi:parvulin-like peptidyl-prolyl isomerase